jgi:hypothetical protein
MTEAEIPWMELTPTLTPFLEGGTLEAMVVACIVGASIPVGSNLRENHFAFAGAGVCLPQENVVVLHRTGIAGEDAGATVN